MRAVGAGYAGSFAPGMAPGMLGRGRVSILTEEDAADVEHHGAAHGLQVAHDEVRQHRRACGARAGAPPSAPPGRVTGTRSSQMDDRLVYLTLIYIQSLFPRAHMILCALKSHAIKGEPFTAYRSCCDS